jgi:hypothetical protein
VTDKYHSVGTYKVFYAIIVFIKKLYTKDYLMSQKKKIAKMRYIDEIIQLRDEKKLSWREIAKKINSNLARTKEEYRTQLSHTSIAHFYKTIKMKREKNNG